MIAVFIVAVAFLVTFVAFRIAELSAASREEADAIERFWRERAGYHSEESSLIDDANTVLPDEWHRDNVVTFQRKAS